MSLQQLPPGPIAESRSVLTRSHDVSDENRGQDPVRFALVGRPCSPRALQEALNLIHQRPGRGRRVNVPLIGELDVLGAGNVLGQVATVTDRNPGVAGVVQHEGRDANRGQDVADVDLEVHPFERLRTARRKAVLQKLGERNDLEDRVKGVFDVLQPRDRDPMLNFDDRDLVESAEVAGFGRVYLTLEIETEPPEPLRWEARPRSASGMRRTCGRSSRPGAAAAGWPPPTSAQSRDARGIPHSRKRREANGAACFNRRTLCVGSR